jgi:hypothetical protein
MYVFHERGQIILFIKLKRLFKRDIQENTQEFNSPSAEESQFSNTQDRTLQFADVVVYESEHLDNRLYTEAAQKVYETVEEDLRKHIKSITVGFIDNSGVLKPRIVNGNLVIFISICDVVKGERILENYNDNNSKLFTDTLAHELVHAQNIVNFINRYGIQEYELIRQDRIAFLAWYSLDEYIACKVVAEQYNSFDLKGATDSIEKIIELNMSKIIVDMLSSVVSTQKSKNWNYKFLLIMFYDLVTRSAFADVSIDHIKFIRTNNQRYERFIITIRELLGQNYLATPLSKEKYYILGNVLLTEYLSTITNLDSSDIEKKFHNLI